MIEDPDDDGVQGPHDLDEPEESQPETEERATRGQLWVFGPAVLGLFVGAAIRFVYLLGTGEVFWGTDGAVVDRLADGAALGAGVGLAGGAFVWAFFPYKDGARTNHRNE